MADHDKDRKSPIASSGDKPITSTPGSYSGTQQHTNVGSTSFSGTGSDTSNRTTSSSTDSTARRMVDETKHQAKDMASRAKEQGRSMFEQQKDTAATQVDSVAHAFRSTADRLQGEGQSQAGRYVSMAAERLESLGQQLRNKDMDTLIRDAENLGRRSPTAFFAGSVIAGFLFSRFLKSSAERQHQSQGMASDDWRSSSLQSGDRSTPASSGTYGATGSDIIGGSSMTDSPIRSSSTPTTTGSTPSASVTSTPSVSGVSTSGTSATPTSSDSKPGGNTYGTRS